MTQSRIKILVIEKFQERFFESFPQDRYQIDYIPGISREELLKILPEKEVLAIRSGYIIDHNILRYGTNLKLIARLGSGMENIDLAACQSKGISCVNSPEGNSNAVGEHCLGLLLSLSKRIIKSDREIHQGIWDRNSNIGFELEGKCIGIIGYGNTGSSFAKKLAGFGVQILAYDKYKRGFGTEQIKESSMADLYKNADILSLHIPYTSDTHQLVNDIFIQSFRKPFYLINTSRGQMVDTKTLIQALEAKKIAGAGLDVLEFEESNFRKLKEGSWNDNGLKELLSNENVIFSSHIAGQSKESYVKLSEILAKKIKLFFRTEI